MFKKFFGGSNKDSDHEASPQSGEKNLLELIDDSPLQIMDHDLYMHHLNEDLLPIPTDPIWQNQALFFWLWDETFERKSLPPEFNDFPKRYFVFVNPHEGLAIQTSEAIPWFGMEGKGLKHAVHFMGGTIALQELAEKKVIQYVEWIDLTEKNADVLQKRGEYYWWMDPKTTAFKDNSFHFMGEAVSISQAYDREGLYLVRYVNPPS